MIQDSLSVPVRAHEASQLAELIFQFAEGRTVDESVYPWGASGRAHAIGRTDGFTRWLIEPSTGRVLGCGIVGVGAGELIAEAALAIESGATIQDVTHAVHPHPTLSETVANAGELYLGTAVDFYKPKKI